MFLRYVNKFLRHSYSRAIFNYRSFASANNEIDPTERDPAPFFFNKEIQNYLKTLTRVDYKKVFRTRKDGHKMAPPQYQFLTDEQLQKAIEEAKHKAEEYLQMPPVVKQRLDSSVLLGNDVVLEGYNTSKFVFTDITYGIKDRERFVVVREPEGTLRHATWSERDRIVQIYFPRPGRQMQKPKMFEDEHLKSLLARNKYEFILDRACIQFEPDDPDYQALTQEVYDYINQERHFDTLRSTRHFGPLVFYLAWTSKIENLLCEMIESSRIEEAALLTRLYYKIHPTNKPVVEQCDDLNDVEYITHYTRSDSSKGGKIEKLLQSYIELQQQHEIVAEGIKKAHGISSEQNKM